MTKAAHDTPQPGRRSGQGSDSILPYLLESLRAKVSTSADTPDPADSHLPPDSSLPPRE